jgi:peptidylprolyl isomerase
MNATSTWIAVALAVVIVLGFFFFGVFNPFAAFTSQAPATTTAQGEVPSTNTQGLMITDTEVGTGAEAKAGDTVVVKYTGTFEDGTVFDASAKHPETVNGFAFPLGAGRVIAGWDQGVAGMKVGGKRHLVVPPELGYGPNDYGPIPGGSTLIFDVELVAVNPAQ